VSMMLWWWLLCTSLACVRVVEAFKFRNFAASQTQTRHPRHSVSIEILRYAAVSAKSIPIFIISCVTVARKFQKRRSIPAERDESIARGHYDGK
jgi:hypothetical protein